MPNLPHNKFLVDDDFNLDALNSIDEIVFRSRKILIEGAFEWVEGGSESGQTVNMNKTFVSRLGILPQILAPVSETETSQILFGYSHPSPIIAAPMGHLRVFHEEGEEAFFRGLKLAGNLGVLSSLSRTPLSEISKIQAGAPFGFQIYPYRDREWILDLICEAQNAGASFGVITLDSPVRAISHSKRPDFDARKYGSGKTIVDTSIDLRSKFDWEDFDWLCSKSPIPLIPKGLFTESAFRKLSESGASGFWISNHGGRALESLVHPLEIISSAEKVKEGLGRKREGSFPIIVDGGFRYGSDVLRALALGADFVAVGRPLLHGLVVGGADGVLKTLSLLNSELLVSMQLAGLRNIQAAKTLEMIQKSR